MSLDAISGDFFVTDAWTDGAFRDHHVCCGLVVVEDGVVVDEQSLSFPDEAASSNRAEMRALLLCLDRTDPWTALHVHSDSQVLVYGFTGKYKRKSNIDLWERIDRACRGRTVEMSWLKGHAKDPYNERADELATKARKAVAAAKDRQLALSR